MTPPIFFAVTRNLLIIYFLGVVAKQLWTCISEILDRNVGMDFFLSIGQMWLSNNRFLVEDFFCAAALWGLWKLRNSICFQGTIWRSVQSLLLSISVMLEA
jgi:hypothetical protein